MSQQPELPGIPEALLADSPAGVVPTPQHAQRIARPERTQLDFLPRCLDDSLPAEHPARAIWAVVEGLDLSGFQVGIRAAVDGPGRPASDVRVLLGLWLLATVNGVGSARQLARLTDEHDGYRWLRGGMPLNYHLLADFRAGHEQALSELLTKLVAVLLHRGLATLERVAQDGLRVRASAGAGSFRRRQSLETCLEQAQAQVARLAAEREQPDPGVTKRQRAARERAARERLERVQQALADLPQLEAIKAKQRQKLAKRKRGRVAEARVSTTDPAARVMKQGDGGFRPAYNVQLVTDRDSRAILAVQVSQQGADGGLVEPLEAQVAERSGQRPREYLCDGGLVTREAITSLAERGVTVYAPVEPPRTETSGRSRYQPRPDDTAAVRDWRERMGTEAGQTIYRERASTAEWTNAQWRGRFGLRQVAVRGLGRVTSLVLLLAVAHNVVRMLALGA